MRKYNSKTKRTILIIGILFVIFIVIFSLFLSKAMKIANTAYKVKVGSILFDNENNKIVTTEEAIIKIKWGGNYYLVYKDENYNLGSHSVVYDSSSGDITLYGKFYEVLKTGDVNVIKDENKIKSSVKSKFYKLADRKYLILDRTIQATTTSLVTSNYLMVNLDKLGNANLINNNVSFKTITPTKLKTSAYLFDIANEKLNFGGEDIDLKKIIGSTNEYDEDTYNLNADENELNADGSPGNGTGLGGSGGAAGTGEGGDGTGSGGSGGGSGSGGTGEGGDGTGSGGSGGGSGSGGTGEGGDGTGSGGSGGGSGSGGTGEGGDGTGSGGSGGGSGSGGTGEGGDGTGSGSGGTGGTNADGTTQGSGSGHNNNYDSGISDSVVEEIVNATKNTSVIRVISNVNSIMVDYVVYDPKNEYTSVFVEIENSNTGKTNVVHLSKTDTRIDIDDLLPDVYYNLTFKYRYVDGNQEKEYIFDTFGLYTKIPKIYLSTVKMVNNKLYYKINLDNTYNIVGGTVNLLVNGILVGSSSIPSMGSVNQITGNDCYFDLSDVKFDKGIDNIVTLKLVTLNFNTYSVNPNVSYKFRY